ncbi:MAG TPA: DUF6577 family protein [Bacteroidota bacterium]|nr:DUF6577 family protein [Bacteroidota bacterium]
MASKTIKESLVRAFGAAKYASVEGLKKKVQTRDRMPVSSFYTTLFRLVESRVLFDAGRGWYSVIPRPFVPQYQPVRSLVRAVEGQFPQLQFSAWSTEQLQPFAHHLMGKVTTFLYTESDAIAPVSDFLQDQNLAAFPNPIQSKVQKYVPSSRLRIIVRLRITEEPVDGHFATIEKTLIDLSLEKERLLLLDPAEFRRIFENIIFDNRVNMGRLFRYADRRRIKPRIQELSSEQRGLVIV